MKHVLWALLMILMACSNQKQGNVYGEAPALKTKVAIQEVLENPAQYDAKDILVNGTIKDVCQEKGCWLSMEADGKTVIVRFKDYAFFVPKDAGGKTITVQGRFHTEMIKHDHENGTCSETCTEQDKANYSIVASGVIIES
ncbi:MAG: DUF4920 domain-containing protein [FCB group bacterium]|nr:DUF4920 domain-containing protein [FCB group bacterium]